MTAQSEFEERIRRDVARTLRHIDLSGLDAAELDGEVVLKFEGGELVAIHMPTGGHSIGKRKSGKAAPGVDRLIERTGFEDRDSSMPSPDEGGDDVLIDT